MSNGLGNPAAVAIVSSVASSEQGQEAIGEIGTALKIVFIAGGVLLTGKYAHSQYKKWNANRYARNNAGDPDLIAAAVIYESFSRFEFPGVLGFLLPSFDVSADEAALYQIASKVTSAKAVAKVYKIVFDRELHTDIKNGLDTQEMQTFWNIINAPENNTETSLYAIGSKLYVAKRNGISVNIAEQNANLEWSGTGNLYGNFQFNDEVGEVIAHGDFNGENYYIVEDCNFFGFGCKQGVVLQNQISNDKL